MDHIEPTSLYPQIYNLLWFLLMQIFIYFQKIAFKRMYYKNCKQQDYFEFTIFRI